MSAAYYAAGFAQDLNLSDTLNEIMGYSSGTASFAVTVGELMESIRQQAKNEARDCWPLAGAEAAANFLNRTHLTSPEQIRASACYHAVLAALTEGKAT